MRYRTLGSSDLEVSEISLGSWLTFSGGVELEQTRACTDAAFEAGINFFDTANVYGRGAAEAAWGDILSGRPRDSYVLATKVWGQMSDDPGDRGLSAAQIAKQIDASLARLQTDHVDLYQAHRFDPDVPIEETIEALQAVDGAEEGVVEHQLHRRAHLAVGRARVRRRLLPEPVLARQQPLGQRRPDDLGDAVGGAEREQLRLGRLPQHRVLRLRGDEQVGPADIDRGLDLLGRPLAEAEVAGLARGDDC